MYGILKAAIKCLVIFQVFNHLLEQTHEFFLTIHHNKMDKELFHSMILPRAANPKTTKSQGLRLLIEIVLGRSVSLRFHL